MRSVDASWARRRFSDENGPGNDSGAADGLICIGIGGLFLFGLAFLDLLFQ